MTKQKRLTNEDRALALESIASGIALRTLSPDVRRRAEEIADLALSAAGDYNNGAAMDASRGGGSSIAWSERARAGRKLTKANKLFAALVEDEYERYNAPYGKPSLANLEFLQRVADPATSGEDFPALMADQRNAEPCQRSGWIEMRSRDINPVWVLTPAGHAALDAGNEADPE